MKREYVNPQMIISTFDVEDVITESATAVQKAMDSFASSENAIVATDNWKTMGIMD